jgi:hypothetical protein
VGADGEPGEEQAGEESGHFRGGGFSLSLGSLAGGEDDTLKREQRTWRTAKRGILEDEAG